MTIRTFYYSRTNFYNTAPKGIPSKDRKTVEGDIDEKAKKAVRDDNEVLPRRLRMELAGRILNTYM